MVESLKDRHLSLGTTLKGVEQQKWDSLKSKLNLWDVGTEGEFTWQNYSKGANTRKARLDSCYIDLAVINSFARVKAKPRFTSCLSDHYPLSISLDDEGSKVRNQWFHTDPALFMLPVVQETLSIIWMESFRAHRSPARAWSQALRSTQRYLIHTRKEVANIKRQRRDNIYKDLSALESGPQGKITQEAITILRGKLKEEEDIRLKHSTAFFKHWWAGKVNRPSKEMFRSIKKKNAKERVPLFKTNPPISSENQNLDYAREHFSKLFSPKEQLSMEVANARIEVLSCRTRVLSEHEANTADAPLSISEIYAAIKSMKPNKTPGLDGLPAEFFATFKELLAPFLLKVWEESLIHQALPCTINAGVIKLIHKKGAKDEITNWRPLTMLNTAYKVYAKAIANRITTLLMKWISKEQKGFIKGRKLVEALILLWKGFENASESGQDFVFVKIHFDKAYDRLEWSFILACLEAMGFGPMLILFIRTLFGNARARIAINDSLSSAFDLSKSVRQGCPLAPLLFAVAADRLNCLV
ncbi:hypothetical protein L7F22_012874 [Adiantum nelumboides]|nr:hypothetical protein [Adiantum nelumboides]